MPSSETHQPEGLPERAPEGQSREQILSNGRGALHPGDADSDLTAHCLPFRLMVDLQDDLMVACNDLERLQVLLADACKGLLDSFHGASQQFAQHQRAGVETELAAVVARVQAQLGGAVTALQFQDMASQLITHTHQRLRNCTDRLAAELFAGDEDGETIVEQAPLRSNPVAQTEMAGGSIDLF